MSQGGKKRLGVTLHKDGADFCVWAPFAQSVALIGDFSQWEEIAMRAEDDGLWSANVSEVKPGQNYKYRINSGTTVLERNDPRARQLTDSDTGHSVIVDDSFDWEDDGFVNPLPEQQIIYELHIGTFNRPDAASVGTFYTAIEKLDYLKDQLGINMIELMPVTSMAMSNGWGYAPNYLFSVENAYGGRHGLLEFVKAAHRRGIGVILDVVYNHFYPKTDLWQFDGWNENSHGGIYFYNDERGDTPWGGRPDYGREEVRDFILDNVTMWFAEYHMDGLRVDSTIYMRNTMGQNNDPAHDIPEAWSLLAEIAERAHEVKPHAILIAEDCAGNEYITKPVVDGGLGFDAQWELGFPHVIREALGLKPDQSPHIDGISYLLEHRYNGNAFEKVIFSDSHDTAANGSVRLNEAAAPGQAENVHARAQTLLASTLVLTAPGIPMLLQGEEFMQEGSFNDWQMLHWDKTEQFAGIVAAHKHLSDLRLNRHQNTAGLLGQSVSIFHRDSDNRVIGYHRWDQGGPHDDTLIVVNFGTETFENNYVITLPIRGKWQVRFCSTQKKYSPEFQDITTDAYTTNERGEIAISLAPYTALILSQDPEG
jgi:1,4-alpha-glucan branching enzyme